MDRRSVIVSSLGLPSALMTSSVKASGFGRTNSNAGQGGNPSSVSRPNPLVQSMAGRRAAPNKPVIALLAYPGMFALDLVAPLSVFASMGTHQVIVVGKSRDIISVGVDIRPHMTFEEAPTEVEILFVPGGAAGTLAVMEDAPTLDFIRTRALSARFVTSVCTGSLILAATGLLNGKKATSHWLTLDKLAGLGAIPTSGRVVVDGNIVTGAGVTSGSDFALTLASMLTSQDWAKVVQLVIEYDPDPPFDAGSPRKAGPMITQAVREIYQPFLTQSEIVLPRVRQRLGLS